MLKNTKGIDVSHHQGKIDWEKVTADGIQFAIIRAGFGNSASQKDERRGSPWAFIGSAMRRMQRTL